MPAPAAPALPTVRIMDPAFSVYRDFSLLNDVGGDLIDTAHSGWLQWGQAVGARWDLTIVPGSVNVGAKTYDLRRKARSTTNSALFLTSHPDHDTVVTGVHADGLTPYYGTIIPDMQIVPADLALGITDTHTAHGIIGDYLGAFEDQNPGGTPAGGAVYEAEFGVKNTGSTVAKQVTIYVNRPKRLVRPMVGINGGFGKVKVVNANPVPLIVDDQIRAYRCRWTENVGNPALVDLKVNGALITTVRRLFNNSTSNSSGLTPGETYLVESGGLSGVQFVIRADCADGDGANIIIWPPPPTEIAPNNGGAPDDYSDDDVVNGDLAPTGTALDWFRTFANIGSGLWNPIPVGPGLRYLETGAANLDEV